MKINIPKVVRPFDLGDYIEEARGQMVQVWINPPVELLAAWDKTTEALLDGIRDSADAALDAVAEQRNAILSELWSQGAEESHWSPAEIVALVEGIAPTDPALFAWMIRRTFELIREYRTAQKKS